MRELYALIVGEGGCPPDYFMDSMTGGEAAAYIEGLNRRGRAAWEQTRVLLGGVVKVATGEEMEWSLPWDREAESNTEAALPSEAELDDLRRRAEAFNL